MRTVEVAWDPRAGQFRANGTIAGHALAINAPGLPGEPHVATGFSPADLLLAGIGACSAWDVVEILRKARQPVTGLTIDVEAAQEPGPPWTFRTVALRYTVRGTGLDHDQVARAVRLSVDRYCSVIATVRGAATVTDSLEVVEEPALPAA